MHSKTFIHQLHHILMQDELVEWIRWSEDDESMFIIKPNAPNFSSKVLKRFFKHGNVSSFVRQLHMYGFHKLPHGASSTSTASGSNATTEGSDNNGATASTPASNATSKSEIEWKFTHHSHDFCKSASEAQLKRIHRKSNNLGKDGKRRNVLSPVCVSYLGSSQDPTVNANLPAELSRKSSGPVQPTHMSQTSNSPVHPLPSGSPLLQQPQPIHQHQLSIPTSVPGPIRQTSLPTTNPTIPTMPTIPPPMNGAPLPITSPIPRMLGTPYYSISPYPSVSSHAGLGPSSSALQTHTLFQYEQNLGILLRSMLQMCDVLSADDSNIQEHLQRLKLFKLELMTTESNWNTLMANNAMTTKSSTASASTTTSTVNRFNSYGSLESQKNSIFSNPRFSKVQKVSLGGTTTQFPEGSGSVSQEYGPK